LKLFFGKDENLKNYLRKSGAQTINPMAAILTATKYTKKIRATLGNSWVNFIVNGMEIIANIHTIIRKNNQSLKGKGDNKKPGIKTKPVGATKNQVVRNQAVLP